MSTASSLHRRRKTRNSVMMTLSLVAAGIGLAWLALILGALLWKGLAGVNLAVFTNGGVVPPGFKMMDIVPADDPLIVEGQLAVNLVDKVHKGLPTELIFSAFNANRTPRIPPSCRPDCP